MKQRDVQKLMRAVGECCAHLGFGNEPFLVLLVARKACGQMQWKSTLGLAEITFPNVSRPATLLPVLVLGKRAYDTHGNIGQEQIVDHRRQALDLDPGHPAEFSMHPEEATMRMVVETLAQMDKTSQESWAEQVELTADLVVAHTQAVDLEAATPVPARPKRPASRL